MGVAAPYIAAAVVGAIIANMEQPAQMPNVQPPPPPPQQEKAPNMQGIVQGVSGTGQGGGPGPAQTFLTGAGGVDPNQLKLGKPTLLGE